MGNPTGCRIDPLPDSVLHHILCFLPIQAAVRCSVLSKRWRHLYTGIPIAEFDEKDFPNPMEQVSRHDFGHVNDQPEKANLFTVVDQFLLSHDGCLRRFSLRVTFRNETQKRQFGRWLRHVAAVNKVEELCLMVRIADQRCQTYRLPLHLFDCRSLRHLKLKCCDFKSQTGGVLMLPILKSLTLCCMIFGSDDLCRTLSECPQLEILTFENFECETEHVQISATHLTDLNITESEFTKLELVAPRLQSFQFDCLSRGRMVKLLGDIDRVKTLKACTCVFEAFYKGDESVHQFNDLEVLIARPCSRSLRLEDIASLLRSSPNLRVLCIERCCNLTCGDSNGALQEPVACLLQLRIANFKSFSWKEAELMLLKHVLKCGPSLESLRFSVASVDSSEIGVIAKELLWIQKHYPQLKIDFPC